MNAPQQLHSLGQSLWLDNISRGLLDRGTLRHYIGGLSVTGLTSNPAIFDNEIRTSGCYDGAICQKAATGAPGEDIFHELALEDLTRAAEQFRPIHDSTRGVDGWVSLEVSPLLADNTAGSVRAAAQLHARAQCPNLFIKLPGTAAGMAAVEECIFRGIPVNVTLLFSRAQYVAAAEAYMRGIKRRIGAGLNPRVACVASIFVSHWDVAVRGALPDGLQNRLGIAMARQIYDAYRDLLATARWQMLSAAGAMAQRVLWASTGTRDPMAPDTLYVEALAAPGTINTLPEPTLLAFAAHGNVRGIMPADGVGTDELLAAVARAGVNIGALAARLQQEETDAFARSWHDMLACIASRSGALTHGKSYGTVRAAR
jgi:transaldolase